MMIITWLGFPGLHINDDDGAGYYRLGIVFSALTNWAITGRH